MNKIVSKLGMGRICLISFIFLCGVFTSENAFSIRDWLKGDMVVIPNNKYITFKFLNYDYDDAAFLVHSYMYTCQLEYAEDDTNYTPLISTKTEIQEIKDVIRTHITYQKKNEKIEFPNNCILEKTQLQPGDLCIVRLPMTYTQHKEGDIMFTSKTAYMSFKWHLPESCKPIKHVKIRGRWTNNLEPSKNYRIVKDYLLDNPKSSSIEMKETPLVFESEISDNVKVSGETDAINVTGVEPGQNIKIYTVSGVEVKSVVANDDVVNIKLPTNQIYIVKTGQTRHKVAL